MNFVKKNVGAITGLISLIIIIASFVGIINASENETLYIRDIQGDRSVLSDVIISGLLQDKYHGQNFTIDNHKISKKFKFYDEYSDIVASTMPSGGNTSFVGETMYYYNLEFEGSEVYASLNKRNENGDIGLVRVKTGVKSLSTIKNINTFINNHYTFINDQLFFTVHSGKTGSNGIFRVDEWGSWPNWENESQLGKTTKITSFSLDEQDIEVLGLKNVNDKLVLYMLIDNTLVFRAYDSKTGELIDEMQVEDIGKIDLSDTNQAFVNDNELTVCFMNENNLIVSVSLLEDLELNHIVKKLDLSEDEVKPNYISNAIEINNKLFVFCNQTEKSDNEILIDELKTQHYIMYVYAITDRVGSESKLLYKGEFMSDSDQDKEFFRQRDYDRKGYYFSYKIRTLENIEIRGE